jgi:glycosidase
MLQTTLPGAPCVYYGDEIGMEGANDPDCRRAYPWDESAWDQPTLAYVRALLTLRHAQPILRDGGLRIVGTSGDSMGILRSGAWDELSNLPPGSLPALVIVNAGEGAAELTIRAPELAGQRLAPAVATRDEPEARLAGATVGADGQLDVVVPARYGVVLLPG